jgi:hypothetical protein
MAEKRVLESLVLIVVVVRRVGEQEREGAIAHSCREGVRGEAAIQQPLCFSRRPCSISIP